MASAVAPDRSVMAPPPRPPPHESPHSAAVPTGAPPVVPTYVPPAEDYEDDEDEVEEVMKPHRASAKGTSGFSLGIILFVALVVTLLSAAVSFYVFGRGKISVAQTGPLRHSTARGFTYLAPTPPPAVHYSNATQQTAGPDARTLDVDAETSADEEPSTEAA
ncbi:uncharacterized protein [Dermacentor albipictus]|uniref:uncharacterized protein n=1 Tax=Dermacentor albipictus TaxID=60249 RepID=UPI0038FBFF76